MTEATKQRWRDPNWTYVKREATDIRKTFARIRRQLKEQAQAVPANVKTLRPAKVK